MSPSFSRRRLARLSFGGAALIGGARFAVSPALAQDDGTVEPADITPGQTAVVEDGPLNLRSGPGTTFSIVAVLANGTIVEVLSGPTSANGYKWYQVNAPSATGYVAGIFLAEIGFQIGDVVYVASDTLNLRSGPGTGYSIVALLSNGDQGTITDGPTSANGYRWYKVDFGGLVGWCASRFLGLQSGPPSGQFGLGSWVLVADGPLNVRTGPGTGNAVAFTLAAGDAMTIITGPTSANGYSWYEIETVNGRTGYCAGSFLTGGFYLDASAIVVDGPLNLRSGAGTGYSIIESLAQGSTVAVWNVVPTAANGQYWFKVTSAKGNTGYVSGLYLGPA
jgi:uncharacterized protein YgiM (DUF1202 family)